MVKPLFCSGFIERMMGLEPTTFCMANASDRSRPFSSVRQAPLVSRDSD
jgi:hypothetical protein